MAIETALKAARRAIILVIGGTVILIGIVLLFLPGQGILTIIAGLAILSTEFVWAKRLLRRVRQSGESAVSILGKMYYGDQKNSKPSEEKKRDSCP
jgi:tellurite resistance protein TerC